MLQVYTGDGKGKTTAALGLALRAAGAGLRVFVGQFAKGQRCSEHKALALLSDLVTVELFGGVAFVRGEPSSKDRQMAAQGFARVVEVLDSRDYDVVIVDEACVALELGLINEDELGAVVERHRHHTEIVLTGRGASEALVRRADLVTEMREIKHYFGAGATARAGIEM